METALIGIMIICVSIGIVAIISHIITRFINNYYGVSMLNNKKSKEKENIEKEGI